MPAKNPLPRKNTMTAKSGQSVRKDVVRGSAARRGWDVEGMGKGVDGLN